MGVYWQFSGQDFMLALPGAWVQSLVQEPRSYKPSWCRKIDKQKNPDGGKSLLSKESH